MDLINYISKNINYSINNTSCIVNKIATNPSATKKVLQIAIKLIAGCELSTGTPYSPEFAARLKGTVDLIEFYGSFKNIIFWLNPFSKESFDQKLFAESLKIAISKHSFGSKHQSNSLFKIIFNEVMDKASYHSHQDIREALRIGLKAYYYEQSNIETIIQSVVIQKKSRSVIQLLTVACFTISDLGGNVIALEKWKMVDLTNLSVLSAKIGNQMPIFSKIVSLGTGTVMGTIASTGLLVTFGEASYRIFKNTWNYYYASDSDKETISPEINKAFLDMFSSGTDLFSVAAPIIFVLSPQTVIILSLIAKGTGVICILVR